MGSAIGDTLPLALGIAISPVPIIAAILMLLSPKARGTSVGFLLGWVVGIVVAVVVFTLLSGLLPENDPDASKPIAGTIKIVLGALLLLLALRQWRSRPRQGEPEKLPKWMDAIDSMTAGRGFVLAFILAAINPKNLLLAAGAGVAIGTAGLSVGAATLVIVVFVVIAASSVAIPVIGYLLAADRMRGPLDALRGWLVHNNAAVITPELKEAEKSGSIAAVAGTRSGTGAALARKIERHPDAIWGNQKLDPNRPRNILSYGWESHSAKNVRVFLEVSRGFSLGIHSRFYPKVTSRECTVAQGMADARLAPYSLSRCYMAIRTFPIRVGNVDGFSSGEWYADQEETSWDDLQQTPELTTVTKRVRRVASFSYEQFMDATAANDPDFVFLNFVNYLPFNEAKKLARQLRALRGNIHYLYGTSPYSNGVRDVL